MSEETGTRFITTIVIYLIVNIILYILYKFKMIKNNVYHKILSTVDILIFSIISGFGFYHVNKLLVYIVPIFVSFYCALGYGLNFEIDDEDKRSVVRLRTAIPLPEPIYGNSKIIFLEIVTFPGWYLIKSWKKYS